MSWTSSRLVVRVASFVLVALLLTLPVVFSAFTRAELADANLPVQADAPPFDRDAVSEDVLWMARCIYSETKRAHEQELVAWVVRNRVETQYRGEGTYEDVVLDPYQFSAFNPGDPKRDQLMGLTPHSDVDGWDQALQVAHEVYHAPAADRPFARTTRHFYSERSMRGGAPAWANGQRPVRLARTGPNAREPVNPRRFRFFANVI